MKVTCTTPFVSETINELPFIRQDDGSVVASGLDADVAAQFADIPGYSIEDDDVTAKTTNTKASKASKVVAEAPADTTSADTTETPAA